MFQFFACNHKHGPMPPFIQHRLVKNNALSMVPALLTGLNPTIQFSKHQERVISLTKGLTTGFCPASTVAEIPRALVMSSKGTKSPGESWMKWSNTFSPPIINKINFIKKQDSSQVFNK